MKTRELKLHSYIGVCNFLVDYLSRENIYLSKQERKKEYKYILKRTIYIYINIIVLKVKIHYSTDIKYRGYKLQIRFDWLRMTFVTCLSFVIEHVGKANME